MINTDLTQRPRRDPPRDLSEMIHTLHTETTPTGTLYTDRSRGPQVSNTRTQIHEGHREAPSAPPRAQIDLKPKPEPATQTGPEQIPSHTAN